MQTLTGVVQRINVRHCTLVHRSDGYSYRGRASFPRINPAASGAGKFDTKPVFERLHRTAEMICRQFDVRYRERRRVRPHHGDHDQSVSDGSADRIDAFDAALRRISQRQTVWKATGTEIASDYRTQSGRD